MFLGFVVVGGLYFVVFVVVWLRLGRCFVGGGRGCCRVCFGIGDGDWGFVWLCVKVLFVWWIECLDLFGFGLVERCDFGWVVLFLWV